MAGPDLYDRRFVFFTGKGGVGKTAVASAFALSCARGGERTLLIQVNVKDKVSSMFGSGTVGSEIVGVEENLFAVNVTPSAALEEYALMTLKIRMVYKAVFENRIVASFLRFVPGLNELVLLGKAYYHAIEKDERGEYVWDKVVVDAPATGHGIFFFQIPGVITSLLSGGPMYDEARRIETILRDTDFTALNIVTLPEEMPVNESIMLHDTAVEQLRMPIGYVVVNGNYASRFTDDELARLRQARREIDDLDEDPAAGLIEAALFRGQRTAIQQHYREVLEARLPAPRVELPYYFVPRIDFLTLRDMGDRLRAQIQGQEVV